jgi:hypothetical protein
MLSVCVSASLSIFECLNQSLRNFICISWHLSHKYFINPSHLFVCLYVYLPIFARQRLGKEVIEATNTHATIEELLDVSFSMRSVSYQRKVGDYFSEFLVTYLYFIQFIDTINKL